MGAENAGRKLGVGLRLAARAAQQRVNAATAAPAAAGQSAHPAPAGQTVAQTAAKAPQFAKGVSRRARRFGQAVWGPMAHTGGVLWLEITGLFFGLFAAFFAQNVYRLRHDYATGAEHTHFLIYSTLTVVFAWFTLSSFYRARQKEKRNRRARLGTP